MQLTDLKGHTVTTLNLTTNSVSSWSTYDSFGNPQTSQTGSNLINYSSYGQQERATNNTGLILMGARVYNPKTNQFTSKDPIPGGNENAYTYPNDPINSSDFIGLYLLTESDINYLTYVYGFAAGVFTIALCDLNPLLCIQAAVLVAYIINLAVQSIDLYLGPKSHKANQSIDLEEFSQAGLVGFLSGKVGVKLKPFVQNIFGPIANFVEWFIDTLVSEVINYGLTALKVNVTNLKKVSPTVTKQPKKFAPGRFKYTYCRVKCV